MKTSHDKIEMGALITGHLQRGHLYRAFVIGDGKQVHLVPEGRNIMNRLNCFLMGIFIGSIVCGFVAFDSAKRVYQLNKIVTSMTEQLGMCETYKEKIK